VAFKTNFNRILTTQVRGQHHRTAQQKAEDMERHLNSLRRIADEENRPEIFGEVNLLKIKTRWLYHLRYRAKQKKLPFNLALDDLTLPERCPILGIPLQFNTVGSDANSFSVDRIDNTKGYTKDNIQVVSFRANFLKGNATLDELSKMGKWADLQKQALNALSNNPEPSSPS
jgi:hypothetical protein